MKLEPKKLCYMTIGIVGIVAFAAGLLATQQKEEKTNLSETQLENAEALSDDESGMINCHFEHGYSIWDLEPSPNNTVKKAFRDCCYERSEGYNPQGSCI